MATKTMTARPIIKTAMNRIGLDDKTDYLLEVMDKIELDMNLAISAEQEKTGLTMPLEEAETRIAERFANGYHRKP